MVLSALLLTAISVVRSDAVQAAGGRWGKGYFPNLPVTTQSGEKLRFYDDVIKDRIVVISFIFTGCTEICPLNTARMAQLADRLLDVLGRSVHFVSISVDPENDTPEKLAAYASAFYSGPGWSFLTGKIEDIRAINARLGERMRSLGDHRNEVLVGNDTTRNWARNSVFGDLDRLAYEIRSMDPAWRAQVRSPSAAGVSGGGTLPADLPGQALFQKLCSGCHAVGHGDRVGPDLVSVGQRRQQEWLVGYLMSPERMRSKNDPIAVALAAKYPTVRMPELGVSRTDADDLLHYIQIRSSSTIGMSR